MKKSATLVEVVVSSIILATVFGGLMASFVSVRKYVGRANKRLVAANLARTTLNRLYIHVREDFWWAGGGLSLGPHALNPAPSPTVDTVFYDDGGLSGYTVALGPGSAQYRQVTVDVAFGD
ncbi:MAG: hypothetical protein GY858_01625 [Candidatus Omnitrophica bacterium]|nr:hypothetical protein [Candidatus Omnitrophota bacterium]